jgi:glucose uptake protein GlcU
MTIMGSLALVFLIVGGILYAVSAGNSKRISQAREAILYSIVGLVIAISAYAIVTFIANSFK